MVSALCPGEVTTYGDTKLLMSCRSCRFEPESLDVEIGGPAHTGSSTSTFGVTLFRG